MGRHATRLSGSATIRLSAKCNYDITTPATASDGLPVITGHITVAGG